MSVVMYIYMFNLYMFASDDQFNFNIASYFFYENS